MKQHLENIIDGLQEERKKHLAAVRHHREAFENAEAELRRTEEKIRTLALAIRAYETVYEFGEVKPTPKRYDTNQVCKPDGDFL
jgi:Tfp pilus assembly protein PilX